MSRRRARDAGHARRVVGRARRLMLALALALGLSVAAASGASAATVALSIPNPLSGVGSAILDKICPERVAPYPQMPDPLVVARGGGPGLYAQYGYAGLEWTTYDAGCLSWSKVDTSVGTQINTSANAVDGLTNELQMTALDPNTNTSFDSVITKAVGGLRSAFWSPWAVLGFAVAGALLLFAALSGRLADAAGIGVTAVVVLGVIMWVLSNPGAPAQVGNNLTTNVATGVSNSLLKVTPTSSMPNSATPQQKFGEGFYSVSYRAWLEGSFCGDVNAQQRYGRRLLDDQAFSVGELRNASSVNAMNALVQHKQSDWLAVGQQMQKTNPTAFGCWKGEGASRISASVKHGIVSIAAGFWIDLGSLALMALRWVLRLAVLFLVTFGALMLASRRLTDKMSEWVLLGLLGPPFVAAGVGTLLWGYYAILIDNTQAWWQAGVAAFALGLAVYLSKGILSSLFVGVREGRHVSRLVSKSSHAVTQRARSSSHGGGAGAVAAGAVSGGATAAVTTAVIERHHDNQDGRRSDPSYAGEHMPDSAGHWVQSRAAADDAEARRMDPERDEQIAAAQWYTARARGAAQAAAGVDGADRTRYVGPDVVPELEHESMDRARDDAPRDVAVEAPPRQGAPTTTGSADVKRRGEWRRERMREQIRIDQEAVRNSVGLPVTSGSGDDRRDDI